MCQSAAIRQGTGSKISGALLELGIGSYAKSRTLIPAARRVSKCSSGDCPTRPMSHAISVAAGEAGSGK